MKNNSFYHITSGVDKWIKISKEGLRASSDGYIYLLTRKDIAGYVAVRQLGLWESYGLIRIDPKGITGVIKDDNVGERTAKYQRRIKQRIIKPEYVHLVNMYQVSKKAISAPGVYSINNFKRRK